MVAGATRLAVRTGGTLSFLLADHIGSSSVTTDANGGYSATELYKAFGESRYTYGTLGTDYKFTGQRSEAALGIYWFQSRWYDGALGRFTQPDTIVPTQTQGTQAWDRYAFVNNNPVRYNDPTGHMIDKGDEGGCANPDNGRCPIIPPATSAIGGSKNHQSGESKDELINSIIFFAQATQDLATFLDFGFSIIELGLIAIGCGASAGVGCIEGAYAGLLLGEAAWNLSGANGVETGLSFASLLLTATADLLDDGEFSEATTTSAVTFGLGLVILDPLGDFAIDAYASSYNHQWVNGIETLFYGGPFFK